MYKDFNKNIGCVNWVRVETFHWFVGSMFIRHIIPIFQCLKQRLFLCFSDTQPHDITMTIPLYPCMTTPSWKTYPGKVIYLTPLKLVWVASYCTKYAMELIINISPSIYECDEDDGLLVVLFGGALTDLLRNTTFYEQVSLINKAIGDLHRAE